MKYTIYIEKAHKHETQFKKEHEAASDVATMQAKETEHGVHPLPVWPSALAALPPRLVHNFVIVIFHCSTTWSLVFVCF